jgi:hypothetical protein
MELILRPHVSRHSLALLVISIAALACSAPRADAASGSIHLGVGDCAGAGSSTADFTNACTANTGVITLYGSFSPPQQMAQFLGFEAGVDIFTSGTSLSPWWHMEQGGCRSGKVSVSFDFTGGPYTCTDFFGGQGYGGSDYGINEANLGPNTVRLRMICAVAEQFMGPISSGTEYYGFAINISRAGSTGPGSCSGCLDRACFVFSYIELDEPATVGDYTVTQGSQNVVTYNGGVGGSVCAGANIHKGSWGSLKSIFR